MISVYFHERPVFTAIQLHVAIGGRDRVQSTFGNSHTRNVMIDGLQ
jgi:hypothetical protein